MYAYDLTPLTGRKRNRDRTIIVATAEVNRFTFAVTVIGLFAGGLPALLIGLALGPFWPAVIIMPVLTVVGGLVLVDQRSKSGLELRRYKTLLERRSGRQRQNIIMLAGKPLVKGRIGTLRMQYLDAAPPRNSTGAGIGLAVSKREGRGAL